MPYFLHHCVILQPACHLPTLQYNNYTCDYNQNQTQRGLNRFKLYSKQSAHNNLSFCISAKKSKQIMARSRRKQHTLFNPFVQAAMSDHNSWETEYAPSTRASSLRHLAIEQSLGTRGGSSDASSAKSSTKGSNRSVDALRRPTPYLHSPTLRALERDRTGETAISHLSTFSNVSPSDGAISIGLSPSLESDRQHGRQLVPETITPTGLKSAWSPDTPSTASSIEPRA